MKSSNVRQPPSIAARAGAGALAGAAATFVMDAVTEFFYTESIKRREVEVSSKGAASSVASKLLTALGLEPSDDDVKKAVPVLHWAIGVGSGAVAGMLADDDLMSATTASSVVSLAMTLFDEFGMSAMGSVPPSSKYPWQTNLRSIVGHAVYGISLAAMYSFLTERVIGEN